MGSLAEDEEKLSRLSVEDDIQDKRMSIAQKKAVEREMKAAHGSDWKEVLGVVTKNLRPNTDAMHDLYAVDPELKELNRPRKLRKL